MASAGRDDDGKEVAGRLNRQDAKFLEVGAGMNPGWNINGPLLWGYFFTANAKSPLERAAPALEKESYRLVDIYENEEGNWWLHVEKEEHHDVDNKRVPCSLAMLGVILHRGVSLIGIAAYPGSEHAFHQRPGGCSKPESCDSGMAAGCDRKSCVAAASCRKPLRWIASGTMPQPRTHRTTPLAAIHFSTPACQASHIGPL